MTVATLIARVKIARVTMVTRVMRLSCNNDLDSDDDLSSIDDHVDPESNIQSMAETADCRKLFKEQMEFLSAQ